MLQAAVCDGGKLDTFAFGEDRLRSAEVNVGSCNVVDALVVADVIVQQGLRTPTRPFFENCSIIGIRGSGCR